MTIVGSDGGNLFETLLYERLRTGRWPEESHRLFVLQQRWQLLYDLWDEVGAQIVAYQKEVGVTVGLRRDRSGNWVLPRERRGRKQSRPKSARSKS